MRTTTEREEETSKDHNLTEAIAESGFAVVARWLSPAHCDALIEALTRVPPSADGRPRGGLRNLFALVPEVRELARCAWLRDLVEPILGSRCFAVRATLFDKNPGANWPVAWHQDVTIAVNQRLAVPGFGPWSVKAGVTHVQPSASVLEAMLAVRIHLDPCGSRNGCLRVIPGSHNLGRLADDALDAVRSKQAVDCLVPRGGVLLLAAPFAPCLFPRN